MRKRTVKTLAWTLIVLAGIVVLGLVSALLTYPPVMSFESLP